MAALATLGVDEQPVQDREQPGAQAVCPGLLGTAAQGALDGGLHQVVGAAGVTGQPQGEPAQALEHVTQLGVVEVIHGNGFGQSAVSVRGRRTRLNFIPAVRE